MTDRPYEYTEDESEDRIARRMEEKVREHFEVHLHKRPNFGGFHDDVKQSEMVVEIPLKSYKWLSRGQKIRLFERGRLPKVWVEVIKDRFGPPSPGYVVQGYSHVDVKLRQQRLSDTDGGLTPTRRIRVRLYVAMRNGGDMASST